MTDVNTQALNIPHMNVIKDIHALQTGIEDKYLLTSEISTSMMNSRLKPQNGIPSGNVLRGENKSTLSELDLSFQYFLSVFQLLHKSYTFRQPLEVIKFLTDNLSLIPLLLISREKIKEYFPLAKLVLEVLIDHEDTDEKRELVIFICTNLSPKEALEKLKMFDKDWWCEISQKFSDKISTNLKSI